jgi:hypothetical protein
MSLIVSGSRRDDLPGVDRGRAHRHDRRGPHVRIDTPCRPHNGYRPRILSTAAGDMEVRIPKLRTGSFFPSLLARRRRVDQALFTVVMEAYLHGHRCIKAKGALATHQSRTAHPSGTLENPNKPDIRTLGAWLLGVPVDQLR